MNLLMVLNYLLTRLAHPLGINRREERPMQNKPPLIRLADGTEIPLPVPIDPNELALPGNAWHADGVLGFYDHNTKTGLMYYPEEGRWLMQQPVNHDSFVIQFGVMVKARHNHFGEDQVREMAAEVIAQATGTH